MSLFSELTNKPWQTEPALPDAPHTDNQPDIALVQRSALRVLLTVISVLFFLFLVAFLMRSQYPDWQPLAEEPGHPLFDQGQLWLNSAYLIFASVFIQLCLTYQNKRQSQSATSPPNGNTPVILLLLAGVFATAFVVGQGLFWLDLIARGHVVSDNPAISFFYLFTGLHAAHVFVGLLVWAFAMHAVATGSPRGTSRVSLCTTYWHFLLLLWGGLFALLVSKPETYDAIAAFCGLR